MKGEVKTGDDRPLQEDPAKMTEKERKRFFISLLRKMKDEDRRSGSKSDADDGAAEAPVNAEAAEAPEKGSADGTAEREAALSLMRENALFAELDKRLPRMEALLEALPELKAIGAKERYELAYFAIAGADASAAGRPTPKELVDALMQDDDAVRLYENMRTAEIAEKNRAFPPHSASKGAASMPANIKSAPKTLNEARKEAYGFFGIEN